MLAYLIQRFQLFVEIKGIFSLLLSFDRVLGYWGLYFFLFYFPFAFAINDVHPFNENFVAIFDIIMRLRRNPAYRTLNLSHVTADGLFGRGHVAGKVLQVRFGVGLT